MSLPTTTQPPATLPILDRVHAYLIAYPHSTVDQVASGLSQAGGPISPSVVRRITISHPDKFGWEGNGWIVRPSPLSSPPPGPPPAAAAAPAKPAPAPAGVWKDDPLPRLKREIAMLEEDNKKLIREKQTKNGEIDRLRRELAAMPTLISEHIARILEGTKDYSRAVADHAISKHVDQVLHPKPAAAAADSQPPARFTVAKGEVPEAEAQTLSPTSKVGPHPIKITRTAAERDDGTLAGNLLAIIRERITNSTPRFQQILNALVRGPCNNMADLAQRVGVSQATLFQHFARNDHVGLVDKQRHGRNAIRISLAAGVAEVLGCTP